jgi:hypothetical protein
MPGDESQFGSRAVRKRRSSSFRRRLPRQHVLHRRLAG